MGTHNFNDDVMPPVTRLYELLQARFPSAKLREHANPAMIPVNDSRCAARHAKWVACHIVELMYSAWFLQAAATRTWLFQFAIERTLITENDLKEICATRH